MPDAARGFRVGSRRKPVRALGGSSGQSVRRNITATHDRYGRQASDSAARSAPGPYAPSTARPRRGSAVGSQSGSFAPRTTIPWAVNGPTPGRSRSSSIAASGPTAQRAVQPVDHRDPGPDRQPDLQRPAQRGADQEQAERAELGVDEEAEPEADDHGAHAGIMPQRERPAEAGRRKRGSPDSNRGSRFWRPGE